MRENQKRSVCKAAILKFPAKQDIVLKIKEICYLKHKTPEQMPFKFLRYLISFHMYADDTQLYLSLEPDSIDVLVDKVEICLNDIRDCLDDIK